MDFNQISPGENPPDDFNVVIEIPTDGQPIKYEVDKSTGA
ncbi:MAG TPA: inorganic pyrophosphatase, partial [Wenzhouxiangellaceae bacterium]|nr:inorganic pyrophosphatase [Wenzhouxiangellaceae bacterium]